MRDVLNNGVLTAPGGRRRWLTLLLVAAAPLSGRRILLTWLRALTCRRSDEAHRLS